MASSGHVAMSRAGRASQEAMGLRASRFRSVRIVNVRTRSKLYQRLRSGSHAKWKGIVCNDDPKAEVEATNMGLLAMGVALP